MTAAPELTVSRIAAQVSALGVRPGGVLLVHSSLSSMGHVEGGAETAIQALLQALGPMGTLLMPALSYDSVHSGQTHFDRHAHSGLMTVYRNQSQWDISNVEMVDGKILDYDKKKKTPRMLYIDYGLGLFQPKVFLPLAEGQPIDLANIYQRLVSTQELLAYEVKQRFYEIGSFEGLRELGELLTRNPNQFLKKEKS